MAILTRDQVIAGAKLYENMKRAPALRLNKYQKWLLEEYARWLEQRAGHVRMAGKNADEGMEA